MTIDVKPAQRTLVDHAVRARTELVGEMMSGLRRYSSMRQLLEAYIAYQHAADVLSGQVKPNQEGP